MNTYSNFDIKKHLSPLKELTSSIKTKEVLLRSASAYNYKTINSEINFDLNKNIINNNKKKCNNYTLYLHDISCTLAINLKEISNIKKTDTITKKEMEIIRYKISYITNLFKNLRKSQKTKKYLNSKILVNNQLLEEIKRKKFEDFQMKKEKKNDLMRGVQKKENTIKKLRAKFKEVEIFVRRESQSHQKYRALYRYFSIDNFLSMKTGTFGVSFFNVPVTSLPGCVPVSFPSSSNTGTLGWILKRTGVSTFTLPGRTFRNCLSFSLSRETRMARSLVWISGVS